MTKEQSDCAGHGWTVEETRGVEQDSKTPRLVSEESLTRRYAHCLIDCELAMKISRWVREFVMDESRLAASQ